MIDQNKFIDALESNGVSFFTGVPDSLLNGFCKCLNKKLPANRHVIAANEGNAVALASGFYFATNTIPLVYMQNSGMGNAMNPLLSLADRTVFSVPMILLIGWRGDPEMSDWEQHRMQGAITTTLLKDMQIPYKIVANDESTAQENALWAIKTASVRKGPVALIAKKSVFTSGQKDALIDETYPLNREDAIKIIVGHLPKNTIYAATTGRATRELYFCREERGERHDHDFLNVGAMGHASSVAMGISLANKCRRVVCLDGDAAAIMHLGALTTISKLDIPNYTHIILNNGAHESVGGQPSAGRLIDFTGIAKGSGYATVDGVVCTEDDIKKALDILDLENKPSFLDIRIKMGARSNLGPLKVSHKDLISNLIKELS